MKYFLAVLMLFCSTVASAYPLYDEKFTQRSDLKERIDHKARLALLSPLDSDIRTYIVFNAPRDATFTQYANFAAKTLFYRYKPCSPVDLFCAAWAHALKVFVSDNKEVMRDYYLGCKLAYHAVSGTDVEEEVPDEILVVCYADTIIPHGTKLRFRQDLLSERYYF